MILAVAWFCADHHGLLSPSGNSFARPAVPPDELVALIGRPVKYFSRMTAETKACLAAASVALRVLPRDAERPPEIGLIAAGEDACIPADEAYFRDYVAAGRSMGRGNLFIYTLPTSTLGEVAIALSLTGPSLFVQADRTPLAALLRQAYSMVQDQEADAMLAIWSDAAASICFVIHPNNEDAWLDLPDAPPLEIASQLRAKVQPA